MLSQCSSAMYEHFFKLNSRILITKLRWSHGECTIQWTPLNRRPWIIKQQYST